MKRNLKPLWPGDVRLGDPVLFNGDQETLCSGVAIAVEPVIEAAMGVRLQHVTLHNPSPHGAWPNNWKEWQLVLSSTSSNAFKA